MRIQNTSLIYSTELIREVVKFARPAGIANFDVVVKNTKSGGFAAAAYTRGSGYHSTAAPFVTLRIGNMKFPYIRQPHGAYLEMRLFSYTEVLVYIMAHELRHLWQAKVNSGWRVWGARGQFSERDACAYGIHKVREWRRK